MAQATSLIVRRRHNLFLGLPRLPPYRSAFLYGQRGASSRMSRPNEFMSVRKPSGLRAPVSPALGNADG